MNRFLHSVNRVIIVDGNDVRRAPIVAELFRDLANYDPLFRLWGTKIESAGARGDTVEGNPDKKAIAALKAKGLDISSHKAHQITLGDILHSSIVLTFTNEHSESVFHNVLNVYPSLRHKLITLSNYLSVKEELPALLGATKYGYQQFVENAEKILPQLREKLMQDTRLPLLVKGQGMGSGMAHGKIRIIKTSEQAEDIEKGDVVVCQTNHVDFLDRMYKFISAIITETESESMHLSQVSYEYGIPCICGASHATEILHTGNQVLLDANSGSVYGSLGYYFTGLK